MIMTLHTITNNEHCQDVDGRGGYKICQHVPAVYHAMSEDVSSPTVETPTSASSCVLLC